MDKLIFLDFDGVLSFDGFSIDPYCLINLSAVVEKTNAKIVVSSSRRSCDSWFNGIVKTLGENGLEVIGRTKELPISDNQYSDRVDEIFDYVKNQRPPSWVAVDDLPLLDLLVDERVDRNLFSPFFVKTEFLEGITRKTAEDMLLILLD